MHTKSSNYLSLEEVRKALASRDMQTPIMHQLKEHREKGGSIRLVIDRFGYLIDYDIIRDGSCYALCNGKIVGPKKPGAQPASDCVFSQVPENAVFGTEYIEDLPVFYTDVKYRINVNGTIKDYTVRSGVFCGLLYVSLAPFNPELASKILQEEEIKKAHKYV